MFTKTTRDKMRISRVRRIRAKIVGSPVRPRLTVFRSLTHISAQLIDDTRGTTIVSANDRQLQGTKQEKARQVGEIIAQAAKAKNITAVVFDRAGYQYHGRIMALAEGARSAGLQF